MNDIIIKSLFNTNGNSEKSILNNIKLLMSLKDPQSCDLSVEDLDAILEYSNTSNTSNLSKKKVFIFKRLINNLRFVEVKDDKFFI